uniref:Uncharacterized protein n=1 Tax=Ailuropoda melanoleuca TaxID=9646 RepID=A0A7N5KAM3_AILME
MCCAAAGAYARGVWLLQAGAGRRRQRQEQQRRRRQLGGGGDGGNGSVGDDGATGGSVQGRGGGVPLREEADSPLHRRHPHGERGLKDLRLGPILYRIHLPSGKLNYLEMSQLHCYLCIFSLNTIAHYRSLIT